MSENSACSAKKTDELELCDTSRLETFSDGAFAIIITLLVLEIHRPNAPRGALAKDLFGGMAFLSRLWARLHFRGNYLAQSSLPF